MSRSKAGLVILAVTLLVFAVMGGFYLGRNTLAGPVRIITQTAAQTAHQQETTEESEPQTGASAGGTPVEEGRLQGAFPININTATAEELQTLPGIGKSRAAAIVAYREEHGAFTYVEDLRAVSGIGEGILANIMDYITVGEQSNG